MTRAGISQILRRAVAAACFSAALLAAGQGAGGRAALLAALGFAAYALWPRVPVPPGAETMAQGPAVIGPDLLAFGLFALFFVLPLWIGGQGGIHGSALMIWALLPAPLALLAVGAAGACLRVTIGAEGLTVAGLRRVERAAWDGIAGWRRWRRGLPRWMRALAPVLPPTAAGAVLLARDSTGVELCLADGRRLRLPREGFERGEARLLRALRDHGVPQMAEDAAPGKEGLRC